MWMLPDFIAIFFVQKQTECWDLRSSMIPMCIIIDTNKLGRFLSVEKEEKHEDDKPIYEWLSDGGGSLVYSTHGKFGRELERLGSKARKALEDMGSRGEARLVRDDRLPEVENTLREGNECVSDDYHILALAICSHARVLHTDDNDLKKDFKNRMIIQGRKGKIYSRSSKRNRKLLSASACKAS